MNSGKEDILLGIPLPADSPCQRFACGGNLRRMNRDGSSPPARAVVSGRTTAWSNTLQWLRAVMQYWLLKQKMKTLATVSLVIVLAGCDSTVPPGDDETKPLISLSAKGWNLKPGPPEDADSPFPTTIVVNPNGDEFNIGTTQYPDVIPATLWIVEVPELNGKFLLIRIPPAASAAVGMPIVFVDQKDRPSLAGSIRQRWEFSISTKDEPGFNPMVEWEGSTRLRDILFEDINADGRPELVEDTEYSRWGGTVTHFRFTTNKTFVPIRVEKHINDVDTGTPLWIETWAFGDDKELKMISRTRAESESDN